jgi:UDP-2-acetamido-3-amino-2,3-dideoxy-glucuronate N-acetyltransferase
MPYAAITTINNCIISAMQKSNFFVHPSTLVDDGAVNGEGTKIWLFCHIMPQAVIGSNCIIGQNCFIDNNVTIGNGVKIQNNVSVYNGVVLEDDVFVSPSVVFTNVTNPRSFIERKNEFKKTLIKRGCSIGANATIVAGIIVGEFSMIGAGAVVTIDVLPYSVVAGNPAEFKGWISESGHKLNFNTDGKATCNEENQAYIMNNNIVSKL